MRQICKRLDVAPGTIFRWLQQNKRFREQYAHAKQVQAELLADELKEISDEKPTCLIPTRSGGCVESVDRAGVDRNRLRVDTRKWIASKLLPKKYGEKLEVEHKGGIAIAERIAKIRARKNAGCGNP